MAKTIAIAGCVSRIGTTTQAIQSVLTVKQSGLKACYLEMNRTGYLDNLLALYGTAEDRKNLIKFSGIDMYKRGYAKSISKKDWDYVIRDYGSASDESFEETSFAEQPLKIVICGSKPNEIFKTQDLLGNPVYDDSFFVFSFVPEEDRMAIKSLMGRRAEKTFFAGITLEPYELVADSVKTYKRIINLNEGGSYGD